MSAAVYLFACFMDANCSARNPRPYLDERPSKEKRITKKVIKQQQQTSCGLLFFFRKVYGGARGEIQQVMACCITAVFLFFFLLTGNERTRFSCLCRILLLRFFTFFF